APVKEAMSKKSTVTIAVPAPCRLLEMPAGEAH
nr:hypothetical protein [Tanacetum cinerariifolium]